MPSNEQWDELWLLERSYQLEDPRRWLHMAKMLYDGRNWFSVLRLLSEYGEVIVTRGKGAPKKPATKVAGGWTVFVDIAVPEDAWPDVQAKYGTVDQVFDAFASLVGDGYRMSFSYNRQSDTVICSVTCREEEDSNFGKTFNAFADTWWNAMLIALYKHYVVAGEDWSGEAVQTAKPKFG